MATLTDMLMNRLGGGDLLSKIGGELNTDPQTAGSAAGAAVAALMGALSKNASSENGAKALGSALDRGHDGGVLDNLQGFLASGDVADGDGILRHALGGKRAALERGLARSTGLDAGAAGKLLAMVAPLVMGALGRAQREQGLGTQGLAQLLGDESRSLQQRNPQAMSALSGLLDSDGDGDLDLGDLVKQGKGLLGKFLG